MDAILDTMYLSGCSFIRAKWKISFACLNLTSFAIFMAKKSHFYMGWVSKFVKPTLCTVHVLALSKHFSSSEFVTRSILHKRTHSNSTIMHAHKNTDDYTFPTSRLSLSIIYANRIIQVFFPFRFFSFLSILMSHEHPKWTDIAIRCYSFIPSKWILYLLNVRLGKWNQEVKSEWTLSTESMWGFFFGPKFNTDEPRKKKILKNCTANMEIHWKLVGRGTSTGFE